MKNTLRLICSCKTATDNFIRNYALSIKKSQILDIGCGDGERTLLFIRNGNTVVGCDLQNCVKKTYTKFPFIKGNGTRLPFHDEQFDLVISFDVMEHIEDDVVFLSEIHRVLRKDGKILLGTPNRERLSHKLLKLVGKRVGYPLILASNCIHIREYIKSELEDKFFKTGFRNIRSHSLWVGLRLRVIDIGLSKFPTRLSSIVQYHFFEGTK